MKKTISFILCLAVLVSTFSFCMPMMALEFDGGTETVANVQAADETAVGLMGETENLWLDGGFDQLSYIEGDKPVTEEYPYLHSNIYGNDQFVKRVKTSGSGDYVVQLAGAGAKSSFLPVAISNKQPLSLDPDKTYTLSFDAAFASKPKVAGEIQVFYSTESYDLIPYIDVTDPEELVADRDLTYLTTIEMPIAAANQYSTKTVEIAAGTYLEYIYFRIPTKTYIRMDNISLVANEAEVVAKEKISTTITLAAPVSGEEPQTTVSGEGYTGTVKWTPAVNGVFDYDTEYTAKIIITPDETHTVNGVEKNEFVVDGAVSVINSANSGAVKVNFAKTEKEVVTIDPNLAFDAPVAGVAPMTAFSGEGYTAEVEWSPAIEDNKFAKSTVYTATITITTEEYFKTEGIAENGYVVSGSETVTNAAGSNVVTVVYPETFDKESFPVTFVDNTGYLANLPAKEAFLAEGRRLPLDEYYDVYLTNDGVAEGLRFNGWSTTGEAKDIVDEAVGTADPTTLYAVVNYDINLAIPANREIWYSTDTSRQTVSVGDDGRTLKINGLNTYSRATTIDGAISIDTSKYAGMVVYFADTYESAGTEKKFSEKTDSYVAFARTDAATSWTSDADSFKADLITGPSFPNYLDLIKDEDGNVIYTGVPATYETCSKMERDWKGYITRLAVCHQYTTSTFEVRYIRFVEPTVFEDTIEIEFAEPVEAEPVSEPTVKAGGVVTATTEQNFVNVELDGENCTLYAGSTAYTYDFVVKAEETSNSRFSEDASITLNGEEITDIVISENGRQITFSYTFPATNPLDGFEIKVSGPASITRGGRGAQYTSAIIGEAKSDVVIWSVSDTTLAEINANTGLLLPIKNGEVVVRATSPYNPEIYGELTVTIENQKPHSEIYYDLTGGTYGENGIEPTIGGNIVILTTEVPTREGYEFLGWALNDETNNTVTTITPKVDENPETEAIEATVYAVWQKLAARFEFNGTNDGFNGISEGNGCWYRTRDTYLEIQSGTTWDVGIIKNGLSINPKYVNECEIRYASDGENLTSEMYFVPSGASSFTSGNVSPKVKITSMGLDDWRVMSIVFTDPDWEAAEKITSIRLDPFDKSNGMHYIDYIRFIDRSRVVEFDANLEGVEVTGMPETATVSNGDKLKITEVPTAEGYKFVGWAKKPDATTGFKNTYTIVNDRTLYAIWTPVEEAGEDGAINLGDVDTSANEAIVVEGEAGTTVILTYGADGQISITVDSNGKATVDLTEFEGVLENVILTPEEGTVTLATVTTADIADELTKVEEEVSTGEVEINEGASQTNTTEIRYPTKVENLTTEGAIDPEKIREEEEAAEETKWEEESGEAKFEGFPIVNTEDAAFADVTSDDWFSAEVQTAYKLGLVQGRNEVTYDPYGNITVAEAITLAVRLNYIYNEKELPEAATEGEWYTPFVNAAIRASIIKSNQFTDYNAPALRKQVAAIMANALPKKYVESINMFTQLPDVSSSAPEFSAIIKLYNAGILMGSDENYSFMPETNITRAEMAAIVNRLAVPENRKRIVTAEETEAKKMKFYAEDLAVFCTISNATSPIVREDGILYVTSTAADINFYFTQAFGGKLDGKQVKTIVVALKWDPEQANVELPQISFTTPDGGWSGDRMIFGNPGATTANGAVEFTFDVTTAPEFANTITGLRFDPADRKDAEFGIEYIIIA